MTITPSLTFGDPINFGVGDNPTALATGDFNGDGNLDLVTANFGSIGNTDLQSSSVLLGNGTGGFSPPSFFAAGASPSEVAIADLNSDGNLDIITNGSRARVRLGDGTGSFEAPISFGNVPNTDSSSNDVIVGDFNNDQLPDIATANSLDSVSVLLNGGNSGPITRGDSATTTEDAPVVINALANDSDPNHDSLNVNGLITSMTRGSVTQNGNTFTYDPGDAFQYLAAGETANDSFFYTARDGIDTSTPTQVFLTITGVNDAPVNSVPERQLVQKNTPLVFSTTNSNSISIQDVDAGTSPLTVTLDATNGVLTLSNTSELSFNTGDGTSDATITFTGTLSNINNALEGLNFIPNAGYTGAASLTITTNDQGNLNDTDTIAIAVALLGTNGNDSINGTVGDDTIYGLAGNDTIFGNEGLNIIDGGDGDDLIFGGSQADTICGGNGNDRIFASEGNNAVFGGVGNDIIYSGKGNDLINGGLGNDRIWLGGGQDTVFIARGDGADTIYNFQAGQTQIGLAGGLQFSDLAISQSNNATSIRVGEELLASLLFVQTTTITASSFVSV